MKPATTVGHALLRSADTLRPTVDLRGKRLGRALIVADIVALVATLAVFRLAGEATGLAVGASVIAVNVGFSGLVGRYRRQETKLIHSALDEVPELLQVTGFTTLAAWMLSDWVGGQLGGATSIALFWGCLFVTSACLHGLVGKLAERSLPVERCLVIGGQEQTELIRRRMAEAHVHASVIASLPLEPGAAGTDSLISDPSLLRRVVEELRVDRLLLAPGSTDAGDMVDLIRLARTIGVRVSIVPRLVEAIGASFQLEQLSGVPIIDIGRLGLTSGQRTTKRIFDLVVGGLALVLLTPALLAIAIAIRIDSRGPVLFRQLRVGRDGEEFRILKFRTMVVDADEARERLRQLNLAPASMFKIQMIRALPAWEASCGEPLDELPQLLNVLRGEMSLVGPRPLVTHEDKAVLGLDRARLIVTPGMTGTWQIMGDRVPMQEMVTIDYLYAASWSLWD